MTSARPTSPREAARIEARLARDSAPLPSFSVRNVLGRSFGVVRQRWPVLALLTFGLAFAPSLAFRLLVSGGYRRGSHDILAFATSCAETLGILLLAQFSRSAVVGLSLAPNDRGGSLAALRPVLGMLPTLIAVWLVSDYDTFRGFWFAWSNPLQGLLSAHRPPDIWPVILVGTLTSFIPLVVDLISVSALGVVTPVIIAEQRTLFGALGRTWRLMSGSRWKVLALYLLVFAIGVALSFPELGLRMAYRASPHSGAYQAVLWGFSAAYEVLDAFFAVMLASSYLELRRLREGAPHEQLATVFN